jgi:uncharacterized membrane-anchored protein
MVQIHSPRPILTRNFWISIYSTVDDFVDGRILPIQQARQGQEDRAENLLNRLFRLSR